MFDMGRRDFITLLSGAAAAWPLAARAEQSEQVRRIGVLMASEQSDPLGQSRFAALRQALADLGWNEGRNLRIEDRWSGAAIDRIQAYAVELDDRFHKTGGRGTGGLFADSSFAVCGTRIGEMARWRQAIELAMTDEEIASLTTISRSRTAPADR